MEKKNNNIQALMDLMEQCSGKEITAAISMLPELFTDPQEAAAAVAAGAAIIAVKNFREKSDEYIELIRRYRDEYAKMNEAADNDGFLETLIRETNETKDSVSSELVDERHEVMSDTFRYNIKGEGISLFSWLLYISNRYFEEHGARRECFAVQIDNGNDSSKTVYMPEVYCNIKDAEAMMRHLIKEYGEVLTREIISATVTEFTLLNDSGKYIFHTTTSF